MNELSEAKIFYTIIDRSLSSLRSIECSLNGDSDSGFISFQIERLLGGLDMSLFLFSGFYYERLFAIRSVLSRFSFDVSRDISRMITALECYRAESLRSI